MWLVESSDDGILHLLLPDKVYLVGRKKDADFHIPHKSVSRLEFSFKAKGDTLEIANVCPRPKIGAVEINGVSLGYEEVLRFDSRTGDLSIRGKGFLMRALWKDMVTNRALPELQNLAQVNDRHTTHYFVTGEETIGQLIDLCRSNPEIKIMDKQWLQQINLSALESDFEKYWNDDQICLVTIGKTYDDLKRLRGIQFKKPGPSDLLVFRLSCHQESVGQFKKVVDENTPIKVVLEYDPSAAEVEDTEMVAVEDIPSAGFGFRETPSSGDSQPSQRRAKRIPGSLGSSQMFLPNIDDFEVIRSEPGLSPEKDATTTKSTSNEIDASHGREAVAKFQALLNSTTPVVKQVDQNESIKSTMIEPTPTPAYAPRGKVSHDLPLLEVLKEAKKVKEESQGLEMEGEALQPKVTKFSVAIKEFQAQQYMGANHKWRGRKDYSNFRKTNNGEQRDVVFDAMASYIRLKPSSYDSALTREGIHLEEEQIPELDQEFEFPRRKRPVSLRSAGMVRRPAIDDDDDIPVFKSSRK
ncbi:hypothetical protein KL918_004381 [Ogataea parapolymorpha]|uniref:Uncharacterized protein n=1 Tax=Ogataea parapolymorpha (strain ATCC 26012 / BCRC 20466 / JCM 22074 / NRRL Y-7560 / DL-1) TaxID=871575 RepID=W1QIG4_OGAPD|nr:hypothetical protein HPODL_05142 [Ogataea parapolymorpha DL-1]ESX00764.1 hypothetical protein HPODL_05142 [Ogataea parapolymorpha DL-1]KAG7865500.1 hypothetical protein KL918_004381 [Ogataea parapolymorpha]KAG7873626.1 hypothetical protein KL916_002230 [Ogataea parapolymorpha]